MDLRFQRQTDSTNRPGRCAATLPARIRTSGIHDLSRLRCLGCGYGPRRPRGAIWCRQSQRVRLSRVSCGNDRIASTTFSRGKARALDQGLDAHSNTGRKSGKLTLATVCCGSIARLHFDFAKRLCRHGQQSESTQEPAKASPRVKAQSRRICRASFCSAGLSTSSSSRPTTRIRFWSWKRRSTRLTVSAARRR